jgi:flagellar basal-body rod modification protein FlgD
MSVQSAGATGPEVIAALGSRRAATGKLADDMNNRFLTLLVTQIRNQDPLNPMDNAQVTSQLAQINTVNGLEQLNKTMQKLVSFYDEGRAMQAASMVGKHVLVGGDAMQLGGEGALGGIELSTAVDDARVVIRDANGLVMRTLELGRREAGSHVFAWDGLTDAGAQAVPGSYRISVEASAGGQPAAAAPLQFGMVNAVIRGGSGFSLDLGELGNRSFEAVRRII